MKKNDACLIQIACGDQARLMELTMLRHAEYCARNNFDYRLTIGAQTSQACFIQMWFAAIAEALDEGYKSVVFLDADTCIVGETDLREACTPGKIGATWHDNADWGDERLYDHFNIGCLYVGNSAELRHELKMWRTFDFSLHPWGHQDVFNKVFAQIAKKLPHRWNSTPWHNEPEIAPVVMAWHGYGNMAQRYDRMKADIARGNHAPVQADEQLSLDDAFVRAHQLQLQGNAETAEQLYLAVISAEPRHAAAMRQLGIMLCEQGRHEEGEAWCKQALIYTPNDAAALTCLGAINNITGRYDSSIAYCDRALAVAPRQPSAQYNRANSRLSLGHWPQGWEDYEWGRMCNIRISRFPTPMLSPQIAQIDTDLTGKTLYLWEEQGQGDTLMCLQLIAAVRERFNPGRVVLECRQELLPLLSAYLQPGLVDQFVSTPDDRSQPVAFDTHCSLMSLPALLQLRVEDLPAAAGYIRVREKSDRSDGSDVSDRSDATRPTALPERAVGPQIGFCWRGSAVHGNDARRSIDLSVLQEWAPPEGVSFHNLCPGHEPPVYVFGGCGASWKHTAERLAGMDLVITVDTAIGHLAGAMGIPTWILLPKLPDFRWMLERADSPWYPSVLLIRQNEAGDWAEVLSRVGEGLELWQQTVS